MLDPPPIRRACPHEAGRLTEIAIAAKRYWSYPDEWIKAWHDELQISSDFVAANDVFVIVDLSDVPIACYALMGEGRFAQLEHVWVEPSFIGCGLGRALFSHATVIARERGFTALLIDSDPHAEAFYQKMGAKTIGYQRADVLDQRRELPRLRFDL